MGSHEARVRRLADRVRVITAQMLETRVKDPRLGFVTITDARVTNDLREATVFYTVMGTPQQQAETAAALDSARGIIRTEIGRQTGIKHTPSLSFVADAVPDNARHIEQLLARAAQVDAEVAEVAAGARYAGDPDPYRSPRQDDREERDEQDLQSRPVPPAGDVDRTPPLRRPAARGTGELVDEAWEDGLA